MCGWGEITPVWYQFVLAPPSFRKDGGYNELPKSSSVFVLFVYMVGMYVCASVCVFMIPDSTKLYFSFDLLHLYQNPDPYSIIPFPEKHIRQSQ